jgi:3-oxoacyl-[acyl-carrier-protein] synthase-3
MPYTVTGIKLAGLAAAVPRQVYSVNEYPFFTDREKEDFIKHVGVEQKRFSNGQYTSADLCFFAAKELLGKLDWSPDSVGALVLVTQTPDYLLPASSVIIQKKLGLNRNIPCFDVNLGCSGWVYGLSVVASLMKTLQIKNALLLTGETSIIAKFEDKATFPLMGDAGCATALEISNTAEPLYFDLNSDGAGSSAIIAPHSGAKHYSESLEKGHYKHSVTLNSEEVLKFCLQTMAPSITAFLNYAHAQPNEIDYFVLHQANKIINESVRKKLGLPTAKVPYSLKYFGNTSSASIPLTMVTQLQSVLVQKKLKLLCSGFGVGFSWANLMVYTESVVCPTLIEV